MSNEQLWSIATENMYLADSEGTDRDVTNAVSLNPTQAAEVSQAFGLWDDVSGFKATLIVDNPELARDATTYVTESFLGIPTGWHWKASLSANWTRVAIGTISGAEVAGINKSYGAGNHYHEIYIDPAKNDGADTFRPGSQAFHTVLHEIGHSVLDFRPDHGHMFGPSTRTIMAPNAPAGWSPSTPMSWDIDQAIAHYGADTATRIGDDTYGFNASFSGAYRSALDFDVNTNPLITIYDSAGNDTLDASGFRYDTGESRPVHIDLDPGMSSWLHEYYVDGTHQTFAVIYQGATAETTTWIENAVGGDGDDEILGNAMANHLYGRGGNDTLDGRASGDVMEGGAGDDTYEVDDAGDQVFETGGIEGGLHDKINVKLNAYDMRQWDKGFAVEELEFVGTGDFTGHGNDLRNVITGGAGGDWLYGHGDKDVLVGGLGRDVLDGGAGDDTLNGGGDPDTMVGGSGDDKYFVYDAGDVVMEAAGDEGGLHDKIYTNFESFNLGYWQGLEDLEFHDNWVPISHLGYGTDADNVMIGSYGRDTLFGFGGEDILNGGSGADWLYGGADSDIYVVDDRDDVVSETEMGPDGFFRDTGGTDEIVTTLVSYSLYDDPASLIENLSYMGTEAFFGAGNQLANVISGSSNDDRLLGNEGNDTLRGFEGLDHLMGGAGADRMEGGSENDTFVVDNGNDAGGDVVMGDDGWDTVEADLSVASTGLRLVLFPRGTPITADVAQVPYTSAAIDIEAIVGGDGNDWIDASRLVDQTVEFEGGVGNDTFIGGKTSGEGGSVFGGGAGDVFDGGADFDTIELAGISSNYDIELVPPEFVSLPNVFSITDRVTGRHHVVHDVELAKFADGVTYNFVTANWSPVVTAGDQTVAGNASLAASSLFSVSDADGDAMTIYRFWDSTSDASSGHFAVNGVAQGTSQNIDLSAADLSHATFETGTTADDLWVQVFDGEAWSEWKEFHLTPSVITGTDSGEVLTGDAAANHLMGLGGNDELIGKEGGDVLDGGAGVDTVSYATSSAGVTVDFAAGTGYGGDAEGDTYIGLEHAVGSAFDDTYRGGNFHGQFVAGDGNDTLIGGSVFDWLEGGKGNDIIIGTGAQTVMFGGDGDDTMTGSLTSSNSMYGGHGNDTITGGDWTDAISDTDGGNETIRGGGGDDVIVDYYGVNSLFGDDGDDWIISATNEGSLLDGGDGDDTLSAYFGGNTLLGGAGNDILENTEGGAMSFFTGGADADTFVFRAGVSIETAVTVTDFEDGVDHIGLRLQPFEHLTITDTVEGAVIEYYGTSPMLLAGISASQITQEDFLQL